MFKAIALKELRQIVKLALLAIAAYAFLIATAENPTRLPLPWGIRTAMEMSLARQIAPFVDDGFTTGFVVLSAAIAIYLGLVQTVGESIRSTYPFLLHRPATRRWLIGVKLLMGVTVYLICGAAPILAYGLWAATPGTHASPFQWSMTLPTWEIWFSMTLLYLGAFLSGIRRGRLLGSGLLPIVAAITLTIVIQQAVGQWQWRLLLTLVTDAAMIACILFIARNRDY